MFLLIPRLHPLCETFFKKKHLYLAWKILISKISWKLMVRRWNLLSKGPFSGHIRQIFAGVSIVIVSPRQNDNKTRDCMSIIPPIILWLVVSTCFNPFEKYYIVKMGSSSPKFGVNIKNIWVATNQFFRKKTCNKNGQANNEASLRRTKKKTAFCKAHKNHKKLHFCWFRFHSYHLGFYVTLGFFSAGWKIQSFWAAFFWIIYIYIG